MKKASKLRIILPAMVLFFITGIFFITQYGSTGNVDGIAYLQLAEWYSEGRFWDAIEPHWSPLIPWLLTPLSFLPFDQIFLFRCLMLLSGGLALFAFWNLLNTLVKDKFLRAATLYTALPFFLTFSLVLITPDILVLFLFIVYFNLLLKNCANPSFKTSALIGATAGFGYLAKSYFLPFFVVHFTFIQIFTLIKTKKKNDQMNLVKQFVVAMCLFILIVSPWIALLSTKAGHFTIGSASDYNIRLINPEIHDPSLANVLNHPMHTEGLMPPVIEGSSSIWDTPYQTLPYMEEWDVFDSKNFLYILENTTVNTILVVKYIFEDSPSLVVIFLILGTLVLIIKPNLLLTTSKKRQIMLVTISTLIIYPSGYMLLIIEERYLWPVFFILLLSISYLLDISKEHILKHFKPFQNKVITIFIMSMIIVGPNSVFIHLPYTLKFILHESSNLITYFSTSLENKLDFKPGDRLASNEQWHTSLYISHRLNGVYYGETKQETGSELSKTLKENAVKYYLYWGETDENFQINNYVPAYDDPNFDFSVWKKLES